MPSMQAAEAARVATAAAAKEATAAEWCPPTAEASSLVRLGVPGGEPLSRLGVPGETPLKGCSKSIEGFVALYTTIYGLGLSLYPRKALHCILTCLIKVAIADQLDWRYRYLLPSDVHTSLSCIESR